jgi:hypothetical protein
MNHSLDLSALEQYSQTFSAEVVREVYARQSRVSGSDILSLTPVKQVNLFVIKALFDRWQQEIDRLESPYFNYDHEEVQVALEEFMNTLSRHISVPEAELRTLLLTATQDTLLLLLSPPAYYERALERLNREQFFAEDVKGWTKYVKANRAPLDTLSERLASDGGIGIPAEEAAQLLNAEAEKLPTTLPAEYQAAFSQVASLTEEDILTGSSAPVAPPPLAEATESYDPPAASPAADEPVSPRTLNDELTAGQRATLVDIHQQQKIANIKSYIGVNQRFMFIRELFNNNAEEYNRALDELEQQNTYIEAFNYLRNHYAQPNRWKMDSEEVVEFLEIIAKRF